MMASSGVWKIAIEDPHLKRLGEYLASLETGWDWKDFDWLECKFMEEPWLNWVKIVMVKNPANVAKPFVVLSNTKGQPHLNCLLHEALCEEDKVPMEYFAINLPFSV